MIGMFGSFVPAFNFWMLASFQLVIFAAEDVRNERAG